jgi:fumarylpyruvate hydrolase
MSFVVPAAPQATLAVEGTSDLFPVHRIYCVGRNYAEHAREMGHDPDREPPFFFCKPADAIVENDSKIPFPMATDDLHHEIEQVVAIGKAGANIPSAKALEYVYGYAVGIDLTRRDLQGVAKKMARPWDSGKAFDRAAPCTAIRPASEIGHPESGKVWLAINGDLRQEGDLNQLIWTVPEIIEYCSSLWELQPGDLIMTGTPAGVGPIQRGDSVTGGVDGIGEIRVQIG